MQWLMMSFITQGGPEEESCRGTKAKIIDILTSSSRHLAFLIIAFHGIGGQRKETMYVTPSPPCLSSVVRRVYVYAEFLFFLTVHACAVVPLAAHLKAAA